MQLSRSQAEATAHRIRDAFDARAFEHHTEGAPRVGQGFGGPRPIEASARRSSADGRRPQ
jgi:hypothetical protein